MYQDSSIAVEIRRVSHSADQVNPFGLIQKEKNKGITMAIARGSG